MDQTLQYSYTEDFPALLQRLGCTLAASTHQAGKLIFIRPEPAGSRRGNGSGNGAGTANGAALSVTALPFARPMGLALESTPAGGPRLAVATRDRVALLDGGLGLAPAADGGLFTGELDLHDLAWGGDGALWAVNTRYSSLARIQADGADSGPALANAWQPPFIHALAPEDRCHLNGMALEDGAPRYVTALSETDTPSGWRADRTRSGVLLDVPSGEAVLRGLPMPHSPRLFAGQLYALLAAAGEVIRVDPVAGAYQVIQRLPGFTRGLACCGSTLFVGLSRLRQTSAAFRELPIAAQSLACGIAALDLESGRLLGQLTFEQGVEEIYDIQAMQITMLEKSWPPDTL